jgi:hypothetical protein
MAAPLAKDSGNPRFGYKLIHFNLLLCSNFRPALPR